jgi:hypothetical protein
VRAKTPVVEELLRIPEERDRRLVEEEIIAWEW